MSTDRQLTLQFADTLCEIKIKTEMTPNFT